MSSGTTSGVLLLLFAITAVVFRLPHLLSGRVAVDGDEAIVGLMALDLLSGRDVPLFFYGQHYGLAILEVLPLAASFSLFGASPVVVKATMLVLWLAGGMFAVRAAARLGGGTAAALVGLTLAILPAWLPWSMKARGGYVTAFWASQAALWLLAHFTARRAFSARAATAAGSAAGGATIGISIPEGGASSDAEAGLARTSILGFLLGITVVLVLLAQPLFLLPLLPFFLFFRPISAWIGFLVGAFALAAPVALLRGSTAAVWDPQLFGRLDGSGLGEFPFRLATALGGYYFYLVPGEPPDIVVWCGRLVAALLVVGVVYALVARTRDRWTDGIWAAAIGILTFALATLWIRPEQHAYRYLLPLGAPAALLLGLIAARLLEERWGRVALYLVSALCFGLCAASAWAGRGLSLAVPPGEERGSETAATTALLEHLAARGIADVYVMDPMYQWNVAFASRREVRARWHLPVDRVPEISRGVDEALAAGRPVALVGDARYAPQLREALDRSGWTEARLDVVADRHFVLESPSRALLEALRFRFDP